MGCTSSCETDESSATCPFGSVTIKHCGCKSKAVEEPEPKTPEQMAEIKARMDYEEMMWKQRQEGKAMGILHKKDVVL